MRGLRIKAGLSQEGMAEAMRRAGWGSCDRRTVQRWESGETGNPQYGARKALEQVLGVPFSQMGFDSAELAPDADAQRPGQAAGHGQPVTDHRSASVNESAGQAGRPLLGPFHTAAHAGGIAALTLPFLGLDELRHVSSAIAGAQRHAAGDAVSYFTQQLDGCAINDGMRGPRQSLPAVLGLIAAIEKIASEAKSSMRRDLLRVGAHASEFAGWLYRDICAPGLADYWRDRAVEWAQVCGDAAMQGYVLLRKSQAAWDGRDALRMLTLAEAVQEGPWRLPARVRAEAAQQQARGHAMLNGDIALIEAKLSEARSLLDQDRAVSRASPAEMPARYDQALFGLQVAICYCEAGQPERSLELYSQWLRRETFSRRDYAYFLALKGEAHAVAQDPATAAISGLEALAIARETASARTVQEVTRLAVRLGRWRDMQAVHELRDAVLLG